MKLLYKPFALIAGAIASRLGKSAFKQLWARIDDGEPPASNAPGSSVAKIVAAAALEAATMASVKAAADHATARAFHHLFGVWPGEQPADSSG